MAILPPHLLPSAVVAPPSQQVVSGTCWRIQVLSDTVIRLEWDPRGDFVDGPTQMMAQRKNCVSTVTPRARSLLKLHICTFTTTVKLQVPMGSGHRYAKKTAGVERGDGGQTGSFLGFKVGTCEGPAALLTRSMVDANSTEGWSMAGE